MKHAEYGKIRVVEHVPMPEQALKQRVYPWHGLAKKGQSFFVPLKGRKTGQVASQMRTGAAKFSKCKVVVASWRDNGVKGVRVWRAS